MNLIIDIGNSATKLAIYSGIGKVASARLEKLTKKEVNKFMLNYRVSRIIVSSVRSTPLFLQEFADKIEAELLILSHRLKLPFHIEYQTPETLGSDRIAAVAGALKAFPGRRTMVIDAGSAITYDFIDGNKFKGGNISPGIEMRFQALNEFTGKLPRLKRTESFSAPGVNTNDAIIAGVITGVVYEINEYIRTFEERHKDLKVIITGGDAIFLKERISGECDYMPDIVTDGLNYILEYNAK